MRLKQWGSRLTLIALVCSFTLAGVAQESTAVAGASTSNAGAAVPALINYSGVLKDLNGKPISGVTGVMFLLYEEEQGGSPLWIETQNVAPGKTGQYTVTLGSVKLDGSLALAFTNNEARWLGVKIEGQPEQPRVLLVAVPYALKAGDAQTIGGLPPSAFMLANSAKESAASASAAKTSAASTTKNAPPVNPAVTGKGTANYIPMWDTTSDIIDSVMFQKSSQIGIGTTTPAATLDVSGKGDIRDTLTLFPKSTDNTLAVSGTTFKVDSTGKVTFISGQTFPGTGTITGITTASGSGLSGGGTTGTLSLKVPAAGITNAMLQNSKVTLNASTAGGLTVPGGMTLGNTYTIGLKTCSANQVLQYNGTSWACAAAGTGTITGITTASGSGLAGGGTSGTLSLSVPSAGITNTMLQHPSITLNAGSGLTAPGAMSLGNTYSVGLITSCSANQILKWSGSAWACSADSNSGGTVTSVATGTGLTGGTITTTGTLSINTSVVPQLAAANTFTSNQAVSASSTSAAINVANSSTGDGIDISTSSGEGVYVSAGGDGVESFATFDGAFLYGADSGSYAYSYDDAAFNAAAWGSEFGSTQETIGLYGYSASTIGIGVYGQAVTASVTGGNSDSGFYPMGVWGDSGQQFGFGVFGTADDGWSFVGYNNSPSGFANTWLENQENSDSSAPVLFTYGSGFGGTCTADVSGNLSCSGSVSAVAPVAGGSRKVALNSVQSPESWFEDAGSGQLSGGEAVVNIESVFGETINTGVAYHVFLTPNGDCKGLYVAQKSATSFVVRELGGGTSSIAFDYRIMAKRRGFEQVRLADKTELFSLKHRPIRPAGTASKAMPAAKDVLKQKQVHAKTPTLAQNGAPVFNKKK